MPTKGTSGFIPRLNEKPCSLISASFSEPTVTFVGFGRLRAISEEHPLEEPD
jgi:hypothetical protein